MNNKDRNRSIPEPSYMCNIAPLLPLPHWRRSIHLAALALGVGGFISTAQADVLLYEGFNYAATSPPSTYLHGQTGALGTTGSWSTFCNNVTPNTQGFKMMLSGPEVPGLAAAQPTFSQWYNGAMTPLGSSSTGNHAGIGIWNNTPDHISAYIPLDSSVVSKLGDSTKPTWMSCVVMANHTRFPAFSVAIGAGRVGCDLGGTGVGQEANGNCVGVGSKASTYTDGTNSFGYATDIGANIWTSGANTVSLTGASANNGVANSVGLATPNARWTRDNKPKLCIVKFIWNATPAGPHTMKVAAFDKTETVNEAAFDARAATNTFNFNPSTFTTLSLAGARWSLDEIRITESFNTAIGGVDAAAVGTYWAAGATGGGTGTWSSSSLLWAANPGEQGTLAQSTAAALSFAGTVGTVTASGTVDAAAGLTFAVNNYQITGGTLNLSGANAGANTIGVVNISDSATIASVVTGSNGLTKSGAGTLALTNPSSTYGGGTVLSAGTLQIATTGSLGSGNLSFQGGTLKYPAGTGTTFIDVSGKIPTVDSGKLAIIDTNGFDATFASAIGGAGGLTKSGSGSLTLSVTNSYSGPTLVSEGNLKFDASQTLSSLSVSNGATATINAGSVQTDTLDLNALSSHMDASANPVQVTTSAKLTGLTVTLTGGSPFSLSNPVGGDVAQPTLANHRTLTASSGTLDLVTTGYDGVLGAGQGVSTVPVSYPAVFGGNGVWTVSGSNINNVGNNALGQPDNHVWHYMALPTGDFDISCRVTGGSAGSVGMMARDSIAQNGGGDWVGIWANNISAYRDNGGTIQSMSAGSGSWLRITRVGDLLTTYRGGDGTNWTPIQNHTFASGQWGTTTYMGLAIYGVGVSPTVGTGTYDNVNFMGTATTPDLVSTNLNLTSAAKLNLNFSKVVSVGGLAFNGVAKPGGTYGTSSSVPTPDYIDDSRFTGSGTLYVITTPAVPGSFAATPGNGSVSLSWDLVTGATGYSVGRSLTPGGPYTQIATPFTVSYVDNSLSNGTTYYYIVKATNTVGESPQSSELSAIPLGPYDNWASGAGLDGSPGHASGFEVDADNDGIANGLEWILGGNPLLGEYPSVLPTAYYESSNGAFTLTFKRSVTSVGQVTLRAEYGADLPPSQSTTIGAANSGPDGNGVTVFVAPWDADFDAVTVVIPSSNAVNGRLFVRLNASNP